MLSPSGFSDPELEDMWREFSELPLYAYSDYEPLIAQNWRWFKKFTPVKEIHKFFDKEHSMGVNWLIYKLRDYDD